MTDDIKMWKEKKRGSAGAAECVTDDLTIFWCPLQCVSVQAHENMESIFFVIVKEQTY